MQYKIPVQIENEDPIVMGLSLRQLTIIMISFWIAYWVFNSLQESLWVEIAAVPALAIWWLWVLIATFKQYEMTFVPFVLSLLRFNINFRERYWKSWIDSFNALDIWVIVSNTWKDEKNKIDLRDKMEQINTLEDKLSKI